MSSNKFLKVTLITIMVIVLMAGSFGGGFLAGHYTSFGDLVLPNGDITPTVTVDVTSGDTPEDLQTLFKPFWESWQILHDQYVEQPLDDSALMKGAIIGMMQSLGDEHSSYMDPQEYSDATTNLSGEYEGIGAWVDASGEYLTVVSPMKGSPAEKAGLLSGDEIRAIDGIDMTGINPELVRLKVIGPAGTTVRLSVSREGQDELIEIEIVRDNIFVPSVTGEITQDNLAYVTLTTFGDTTTADLHLTLKEMLAQNPDGLILDLRNNGGGYLKTAIEVASEFIADGVILFEQYGDGTRETYNTLGGGLATEIPMVVLVNEGSASASEIVAGAIQDLGRASLVGVTTYGKGSVQNWVPLSNDQGAIRVTIAKWLTPNGLTIHKLGLTPDYIVERTENDYNNGTDPQFEFAVDLLLNP
ncbi:S41 family peptidase [Chloroflexota bacterium]